MPQGAILCTAHGGTEKPGLTYPLCDECKEVVSTEISVSMKPRSKCKRIFNEVLCRLWLCVNNAT